MEECRSLCKTDFPITCIYRKNRPQKFTPSIIKLQTQDYVWIMRYQTLATSLLQIQMVIFKRFLLKHKTNANFPEAKKNNKEHNLGRPVYFPR